MQQKLKHSSTEKFLRQLFQSRREYCTSFQEVIQGGDEKVPVSSSGTCVGVDIRFEN